MFCINVEDNFFIIKSQEKCCLVKNIHHIKGSQSFNEMDYICNIFFELFFFASQTENTFPKHNIPLKSNSNEGNQRNLCSLFLAPKQIVAFFLGYRGIPKKISRIPQKIFG